MAVCPRDAVLPRRHRDYGVVDIDRATLDMGRCRSGSCPDFGSNLPNHPRQRLKMAATSVNTHVLSRLD